MTIGFAAATTAEVDAFHAADLANSGTDEGAPGPRSHLLGTYAAYLRPRRQQDMQLYLHGWQLSFGMEAEAIECKASHVSFGGVPQVWRHRSVSFGVNMNFDIYLPPQAKTKKVPLFYWLSGLTRTKQNFIGKTGAQRVA